jgi:hypothetical protein
VLIDNTRISQCCNPGFHAQETMPTVVTGPSGGVIRNNLLPAYGGAHWAERDFGYRDVAGDPTFVVMADRMRRGGANVTYQWTMHTDARNAFTTDGAAFRLAAPTGGAILNGATTESHGTAVVYGQPWDAARYNATAPYVHNIVKSTTLSQRDFDHLAVLGISRAGQPEVAVTRQVATGGSLLRATWGAGSELLVAGRNQEAVSLSSARLVTDAKLAMVTPGKGETSMVAGTSVVVDGRTYVSMTGGAGAVVVGGDAVEAKGPAGATYRVFAPQAITTVRVNGVPVPFQRVGDDLTF